MPDLLAHALVAYALVTVVSWRVSWVARPYVTVAMAGAFIPDLTKIKPIVPNVLVRETLGVPFDWFALHTAGGVLVSIAIGAVLVTAGERRRVVALLGLGAGSHLIADLFIKSVWGWSYAVLWPFSSVKPRLPGLYLSTDPAPTAVAGLLALGVFLVSRGLQARHRAR